MDIKIITLNIWLGGLLMDNALSFLKRENPDILFLQEVYNGEDSSYPAPNRTIQVLRENLNLNFHIFSANFKDTTPQFSAERGNAIFSRFPLKEVSNIFYDTPYTIYDDVEAQPDQFPILPRALQHVTTTVHDKKIDLFNTQGIWALNGEDSERRLHMSDVIVNEVKEKQHVILAGDFNVSPNTKSIHKIEEHLKNAFKDELSSSFNMKHKDNPGYATAVVDMLFVTPNIQVVEHYCPSVDVSDHLPLVAVLEV